MRENTKERLLAAINTVLPLDNYESEDYLFAGKYGIVAVDMIYVLKQLAVDFHFAIDDDFVDAMEMCTFGRFEELLEKYSGTAA